MMLETPFKLILGKIKTSTWTHPKNFGEKTIKEIPPYHLSGPFSFSYFLRNCILDTFENHFLTIIRNMEFYFTF